MDRFTGPLSPEAMMEPRNLGALPPTRFSATRSFLSKVIREGWHIELDHLQLDRLGNGTARYTITTPNGSLTFAAWLREPDGQNRSGRIIGTAWDMIGTLIDGIASEEQLEETAREIPKLYEGRAPAGTFIWMRSNQSVRVFTHVRERLAQGLQPDPAAIKRVGYLMRNTGLDGNGTFGTTSFADIDPGHPLAVSYHAQMLCAYLMRELSVDVVEELARLDAPAVAVPMSAEVRRLIGVGNGSALGLVMFVYNRPLLVNAYVSAYVEAVRQALDLPLQTGDRRFEHLLGLLDRTIRYRSLENTNYRVFTGGEELAADLRRVRAHVRAASRGELLLDEGEAPLDGVQRHIRSFISPEALHIYFALTLELIPETCDVIAEERLAFNELLDLDSSTPIRELRRAIERNFEWALSLPLNDESYRDRVWYQSRAAEEPRSGPREEVPGASDVVPSYADEIRALVGELDKRPDEEAIGFMLGEFPELEWVVRVVLATREAPYAVPHADPHDIDFVPVWLVRFMNSFVHGLDRTEDMLNRAVLGLIYEGAPFRDELAGADPSGWWWQYQPVRGAAEDASIGSAPATPKLPGSPQPVLAPKQSAIVAPQHSEGRRTVVKLREVRLASGRAMQALHVPAGAWQGAREFFITALAADDVALGGFADVLARTIDTEGHAPAWVKPTLGSSEGKFEIDVQGQSLLTVGHVVVNMLGAIAGPDGRRVALRNVVLDGGLAGLKISLARYGISMSVEGTDSEEVQLEIVREPSGERLRSEFRVVFNAFLRRGLEVDEHRWWAIYFPGNAGLYPDTPISRQHTGSVKDVYVPGQQLTKMFDQDLLENLTDPMQETDILPRTGIAENV